MSSLFLFIGIIAIIIGLLDLFIEGDIGILLIGIIITGCSVWAKSSDDKKEYPKTDSMEVVSDSSQVIKDSIYEMQLIISWKDVDGSVWAGSNIKLMGHTEKNIGDTITIKIK